MCLAFISIVLASSLLLSAPISAKSDAEIVPYSQIGPVEAGAFPAPLLEGWKEKSFVGHTLYEPYRENGKTVLKATAANSASVLYKQETIDLTDTPWLEWTWKVDAVYNNIDEQSKAGDDFPARLYVTAKSGVLPWQTIAINYVWSSKSPINEAWENPFTSKSMMVSVQSGNTMAGHWVSQRRNIVEDFRQLFNIEVKRLSGYAVMVDGDNSSQTGTAYFGNIDFKDK